MPGPNGASNKKTDDQKIGGLQGFLTKVLPSSLVNGLFDKQANTGAQTQGNVQQTVRQYPTADHYIQQFGVAPPQGIYDENGLPISVPLSGPASANTNTNSIQNYFRGK